MIFLRYHCKLHTFKTISAVWIKTAPEDHRACSMFQSHWHQWSPPHPPFWFLLFNQVKKIFSQATFCMCLRHRADETWKNMLVLSRRSKGYSPEARIPVYNHFQVISMTHRIWGFLSSVEHYQPCRTHRTLYLLLNMKENWIYSGAALLSLAPVALKLCWIQWYIKNLKSILARKIYQESWSQPEAMG